MRIIPIFLRKPEVTKLKYVQLRACVILVALVFGESDLTLRLAIVSYAGVSCIPNIPGCVGR